MSLSEYNKKRTFKKTPEPEGEPGPSGGVRFVVQKHSARRLHYDLRLELDGTLKSWAVPKGPSLNPKDKRLAVMVEDHPVSYIDFEGNIPEGNYGAGDVIVWDKGVYMSREAADIESGKEKLREGLRNGEIKFVLLGEKLKGAFVLVKMEGREKNMWLLIKEKDEFASEEDVTEKSESMPRNIRPMLAKQGEEPFDRKNWLFEIKWDGYRAIAEIENGEVNLYSRKGKPFAEYKPVAEALKKIKNRAVLDGEIVAVKDGKPDFHTLQEYKLKKAPLQYAVFDILYLDGEDLRGKPLAERKKILRNFLSGKDRILLYSEHVEEAGKAFFCEIVKKGIEGVIAKDAESPYLEGIRGDRWIKFKKFKDREAVIVGYTKPKGARKNLGALVLAAYDSGKLRYIGHSGGGFTDKELLSLKEKLDKISRETPTLTEKIPINSPITWVLPKYVIEIVFSEWTPEGRMRHPIYKRMLEDKDPKEVLLELPDIPVSSRAANSVSFTNTDKIFWPDEGYTKGDVIEYYKKMAEVMLPYLIGRPQNMNRHPDGIEGPSFYQKDNLNKVPDFVRTEKIWSESNEKMIRYLLCQNKETLLYMANLGCIEINPWSSRIGTLEKPDYMIIDLDPGKNTFNDVIKVAEEVRKILDIACESHFPKTSGKTGMHVLLPLAAKYDYAEIRIFAELLMRIVNMRIPELTSVERKPEKRKGKIYLDFLQNRMGQTIAAPYSLRPYPGATVSAPLEWSEVKMGLDPAHFNIESMPQRLADKGDLCVGLLGRGTDLLRAIGRLEKEISKNS